MKLDKALKMIHAPKGMTSILAGLSTGDFSVLPHQKGLKATMDEVDEKIAQTKEAKKNCTSDWSYWSILSDLVYWETVKNILLAAEITGPQNLPDMKGLKEGGVVMDAIYNVEQWGISLLKKARSEGNNDCHHK